jgi:hypothetical protein
MSDDLHQYIHGVLETGDHGPDREINVDAATLNDALEKHADKIGMSSHSVYSALTIYLTLLRSQTHPARDQGILVRRTQSRQGHRSQLSRQHLLQMFCGETQGSQRHHTCNGKSKTGEAKRKSSRSFPFLVVSSIPTSPALCC